MARAASCETESRVAGLESALETKEQPVREGNDKMSQMLSTQTQLEVNVSFILHLRISLASC